MKLKISMRLYFAIVVGISVYVSGILYGLVWQEQLEGLPMVDDQPQRIVKKTAATITSSTSITPPCNTIGTYYFFEGKYHHHPDSASFRRALAEGIYDKKHDTSSGLLYALTGTENYIRSAFCPVIDHLRTIVGIPDAADRRRLATGTSAPQQWSLAMDPFACNLLAASQTASILPFFDVLVIANPGDVGPNTTALWDPYEHARMEAEKKNNNNQKKNKDYGIRSKISNKTMIGVVSWEDRQHRRLRRYVMGLKMLALKEAPFPISTLIDVDLLPCRKDFDAKLMEHVREELVKMSNNNNDNNNDSSPVYFDLAVTNVADGYAERHPNHWDPVHYALGSHFNDSLRPENSYDPLYDFNIHNTMCTILNMTSPRTRFLLERATNHFFGHADLRNDQPSIGEAMYETMKKYRSNNLNERGEFQSEILEFRHVDMSTQKICRNHGIRKGLLNHACANAGGKDEDGDDESQCILVHKTSGENEKDKKYSKIVKKERRNRARRRRKEQNQKLAQNEE